MTKLVRDLLCWLGVHELPPGVQHRWSIVWACHNCSQLVDGGLTEKRKRR